MTDELAVDDLLREVDERHIGARLGAAGRVYRVGMRNGGTGARPGRRTLPSTATTSIVAAPIAQALAALPQRVVGGPPPAPCRWRDRRSGGDGEWCSARARQARNA